MNTNDSTEYLSDDIRKDYKKKILAYQVKYHLSQRALAKKMNVSPATIQRLCSKPEVLPTGAVIEAYKQAVRNGNFEKIKTLKDHLDSYFIQKKGKVISEADLSILSNTLTEIFDDSRIISSASKPEVCGAYYHFLLELLIIVSDLCSQKQSQIDKMTPIIFRDEQIKRIQDLIDTENISNEKRRKKAGLI